MDLPGGNPQGLLNVVACNINPISICDPSCFAIGRSPFVLFWCTGHRNDRTTSSSSATTSSAPSSLLSPRLPLVGSTEVLLQLSIPVFRACSSAARSSQASKSRFAQISFRDGFSEGQVPRGVACHPGRAARVCQVAKVSRRRCRMVPPGRHASITKVGERLNRSFERAELGDQYPWREAQQGHVGCRHAQGA